MNLSAKNVNFLGLTNKMPVSSKAAEIAKNWEKEDPEIFKNKPIEELCPQAAELKKLNDIGFKAFYQSKGKLKEIQPNSWQKGEALEKGPRLHKGLEEGYYKLERVEEKIEAGFSPDKIKGEVAEAVWDSSDLNYSEIKAKIAEVEAKYQEVIAQKEALINEDKGHKEEGYFSKELDEVEKFFGVVEKPETKSLKLFS